MLKTIDHVLSIIFVVVALLLAPTAGYALSSALVMVALFHALAYRRSSRGVAAALVLVAAVLDELSFSMYSGGPPHSGMYILWCLFSALIHFSIASCVARAGRYTMAGVLYLVGSYYGLMLLEHVLTLEGVDTRYAVLGSFTGFALLSNAALIFTLTVDSDADGSMRRLFEPFMLRAGNLLRRLLHRGEGG